VKVIHVWVAFGLVAFLVKVSLQVLVIWALLKFVGCVS